jgi:hypothetical protein
VANFLRTVKQSRWYKNPRVDWLRVGEVQADALLDLRTKDNALSVYEVKNDAEAIRVATALAATRDHVDHFSYAVFEGSQLPKLGIEPDRQDGDTPDAEVNKLHYDLQHLTVEKLSGLAQLISQGELRRILKKQMLSHLLKSIEDGNLDRSRIKASGVERL